MMGFSPGEFKDDTRTVHWEGRPGRIMLWNDYESEVLLSLSAKEARKALDQLALLVEMLEADAL